MLIENLSSNDGVTKTQTFEFTKETSVVGNVVNFINGVVNRINLQYANFTDNALVGYSKVRRSVDKYSLNKGNGEKEA